MLSASSTFDICKQKIQRIGCLYSECNYNSYRASCDNETSFALCRSCCRQLILASEYEQHKRTEGCKCFKSEIEGYHLCIGKIEFSHYGNNGIYKYVYHYRRDDRAMLESDMCQEYSKQECQCELRQITVSQSEKDCRSKDRKSLIRLENVLSSIPRKNSSSVTGAIMQVYTADIANPSLVTATPSVSRTFVE